MINFELIQRYASTMILLAKQVEILLIVNGIFNFSVEATID